MTTRKPVSETKLQPKKVAKRNSGELEELPADTKNMHRKYWECITGFKTEEWVWPDFWKQRRRRH